MKKLVPATMIFASITTGMTAMTASYAQDMQHMDAYSMCSKETDHATLYDYGKKLAEGWIYRMKNDAQEEKKYPVKTKTSFFTRAMVGYTEKYKIGKENVLYFCYMGYARIYRDKSWSSVHQGLVEYLPNQSKQKFLSLPER